MTRNHTIDIMRFIGLVLIIMAHTISPQTLIFQLRNFDVPMMVIISWMAFFLSNTKKINLKSYYKKRILRLILPTWIFLSLFFIIIYLFSYLTWNIFPFSWKVIWTFLLFQWDTSIWYVWIIRVFLLIALLNPLLLYLYNKFNKYYFTILLLVFYFIYELLINYFPFGWKDFFSIFIHQYIYYLIPYWILSWFWIILINLKLKYRLIATTILWILLLSILKIKYWSNIVFYPQDFKYPAQDYYLVWGLFMSFLISSIFIKTTLKWIYKKMLEFFSNFSLWLYFWHIVIIYIITISFNINNWYKKFILVLLLSIIITIIHKNIFIKISKLFKNKPKIQKYIKIIFII
jgi:hypothetical protein